MNQTSPRESEDLLLLLLLLLLLMDEDDWRIYGQRRRLDEELTWNWRDINVVCMVGRYEG